MGLWVEGGVFQGYERAINAAHHEWVILCVQGTLPDVEDVYQSKTLFACDRNPT